MRSLLDNQETLSDLIKCAWDFPILQNFMKHNHAWVVIDPQHGDFNFCLRISPYVWAPVRHELHTEAMGALPAVFNKFSQNNKLRRQVKFVYDDLGSRSLEWQIEAYQEGIFKHMDLKSYYVENFQQEG